MKAFVCVAPRHARFGSTSALYAGHLGSQFLSVGPTIPVMSSVKCQIGAKVESRMGAVAWGLRPTLRFPSPLIKPSVPISGTRLSDWLHHKTHDGRPLYAGV